MCMVSHKQILEVLGEQMPEHITSTSDLYSVDISVSINPYGLNSASPNTAIMCLFG